jgi:MSHA biogenesis protein MshG
LTNFNYKARDRAGVLVAGQLEAENKNAAAVQLGRQNLSPIAIDEIEAVAAGAGIEDFFASLQTIKPQDLVVFARQLASTLDAGVPLINSLDAVAEQIGNRKFREVILQVKRGIEGGDTFSDALAKNDKYFSAIIINMVRGGEKAGILPQVLDRVATIMEKDLDTAGKIKSATRYPIIVVFTLAIAFVVLTMFVIPRFVSFFASFKAELPLPTRILIGANYYMSHYWYYMLAGLAGFIYVFRRVLATESGRYNWDKLMLSAPVFGILFTKIYLSRFGRMLSAMLGSGIPILEALVVTAATIENKVLSGLILGLRDGVAQGRGLAELMKEHKAFPPIAVSMVSIGEKAGTLENMLNKMADYFDREIDYTIDNLTPLIEPMLLFGLAGVMMVFALGIFLPMWDLIKVFKTN